MIDTRAITLWNRANKRARDEYAFTLADLEREEANARARELARAKADLLVATSPDECADLLAVIAARRARCGTESGYQSHRRRSERPCRACLRAKSAATRSARGASA